MKKIFFRAIVFIFTVLISGCRFSRTITSDNQPSSDRLPISYSEQRKLDVSFTDGIIQKMHGNYPEAINKFKKCLDIYPNHAASLYEIAYISNGIGKSADAIPYAEKAVALDESNEWYRLLLAKCFMETGRFHEAADAFSRLVKQNPNKVDYYFLWASSLLRGGKPKEAIEVYDRIEGLIGVSEEISLQKERIYLMLNQFDKAVAEAQKLIKSNPGEVKFHRLLAELYLQNNKTDKAMEVCEVIFRIDPNDPETHLMLADYYEKLGQDDKAFSHLKIAFENPDLNIDDKIKILISYFNLPEKFKSEREESDILMNILLRVHPNDARTHSIHGDFLFRDGKNAEAREAFRRAISIDRTRYPIWQQVMALDELLNDFDAMETDSRQAMELFPSEPYTYLFNASANYHKKNYKRAIEVANEGKDYVVGDKKMLAHFYSVMGDCYNALKEYPKSDEVYEKALNLDPENANIMNNWAYYLSLRNEKLEKAEQMSRKSNQLVKDNPAYEDTYAWILYKQKNYEEAKRWQERAIEHSKESNGTLLEHYGDILYQLGQKEKAIEYWKKAKSAGKHSDFLDKKLADKVLYE